MVAQLPDIDVGNWQTTGLLADLDAIGDLANEGIRRPGCFIRRAANQSIPNVTITPVSFDTETFDNDAMWAAGTPTQLDFNEIALYLVVATVTFASNATGLRRVLFAVDQQDGPGYVYFAIDERMAVSGTTTTCKVVTLMPVQDNWPFRIDVQQASGGALNATATVTAVLMSAAVVG